MVGLGIAARGDRDHARRQKSVRRRHRLAQQPAAVVAQIQHDAMHRARLGQRILHRQRQMRGRGAAETGDPQHQHVRHAFSKNRLRRQPSRGSSGHPACARPVRARLRSRRTLPRPTAAHRSWPGPDPGSVARRSLTGSRPGLIPAMAAGLSRTTARTSTIRPRSPTVRPSPARPARRARSSPACCGAT